MRRSFGAVWDTNELLTGPLKFRFLVTSGFRRKYILAQRDFPIDWKNGQIYDVSVQVTDIALENCHPLPCDKSTW